MRHISFDSPVGALTLWSANGAITRLPPRERLVIALYYYEELTMKESGATLDLSESRVSQMHTSIVNRVQQQLTPRRVEFGT